MRAVAAIFRGNEELLRAFMHLGAVDDEIARRGSEGSTDLARQFEETVLHHRDEITHPDPEKAVDVAFRMTYCTFARQVMYGPTFESDREIGWDDLVDEVGAACAAYLLAERSGGAQAPRFLIAAALTLTRPVRFLTGRSPRCINPESEL